MRFESFQQFAIVAADSAQQLSEQLNEKLYELRTKRPQVTFEGLIARISYSESVAIPEDLVDQYDLAGVRLSCGACPFFEPRLNMDGSEDKRAKWGACPCASYGRTSRTSIACNRLFEMLNSGEVKLCLAESAE